MPAENRGSYYKLHFTDKWFSAKVEMLVSRENISYMDAILELCTIYSMEPATAATLINNSIKQHVEKEAIELNIYKCGSKSLPGL